MSGTTEATQRLYGVLATNDLLSLALGRPQFWVTEEGDALTIAGRHLTSGFCWCQPSVVEGLGWRRFTHRAQADK